MTISVRGYHAADQRDGGGLFTWSPQSTAMDNGGTVIMPATTVQGQPGRWVRTFDGMVNVKWFGAVGNGKADDTVAVQRAIDQTQAGGALLFPAGQYSVTMLDTRRSETTWYFEHAELIGNATERTPCVLRIRGLHSRFFDVRINVGFNDHYACALWWQDAQNPSQHNDIYGLEIRYARRGIVYGAMPGETGTQVAQSENTIFGYHSRGVERPILVNHRNGVLFLSAPQLVAHDEEWERDRPGTFDYSSNHAFEAVAGTLVITGGEIQNSIAAISSHCAVVDGGEVHLNGCIIEVSTPFRVSGRLIIHGGRLLNTQSMTSQFVVLSDPKADTAMIVSDCHIFRNPDTGSFSDQPLAVVESGSSNSKVVFDNCDIDEWAMISPLVAGSSERVQFNRCRWRPRGTAGRNYLLDTQSTDLLEGRGIDRAGRSLRGFWPQGTADAQRSLSSDTPQPAFAASLSVSSPQGVAGIFTADTTSLQTLQETAVSVRPGDQFFVEAWVRSASGKSASLSAVLFDGDGQPIRDRDKGFLVIGDMNQKFISDRWRYVRQIVDIPPGAAAYAGFGGHVRNGEIRFCGLRVRRADY